MSPSYVHTLPTARHRVAGILPARYSVASDAEALVIMKSEREVCRVRWCGPTSLETLANRVRDALKAAGEPVG